MTEYAFDIELRTCVRVTAIKSNQQALRKEREGEAKENGHELPQGA